MTPDSLIDILSTLRHGQILLSEPIMNPIIMAKVSNLYLENNHVSARENKINPVIHPAAKVAIIDKPEKSNVVRKCFKVGIMMEYIPNSSSIKLPLIPGNIKAHMARTAEMKTYKRLVLPSAGEMTVIR